MPVENIQNSNIKSSNIAFVDKYINQYAVKSDLTRSPKLDETAIRKNKGEKIKFKEGKDLVFTGFIEKTKEVISSIIKHPIKTLGIIGLTTAGLFALPLIGINMAMGAAGLAIIFGTIALGKTTVHAVNALKHNEAGEYNKAREDLKKIGGDSLDLALSLPFVPKAIGTIKNGIKYSPAIGVNKDLIKEIGKEEGLWGKLKVLKNTNTKMMEEVNFNITLDKLKVPASTRKVYLELRHLKGENFVDKALKLISKDKGFEGLHPKVIYKDTGGNAGFAPFKGHLELDLKVLKDNYPQSKLLTTLAHEFEHFDQMSYIVRKKGGIEALAHGKIKKLCVKKNESEEGFNNILKLKDSKNEGERFLYQLLYKNHYDKLYKQLQSIELYKNALRKKGWIKEGTAEAAKADKYLKAQINYVQANVDIKAYRENLLEIEAYKIGEKTAADYLNAESARITAKLDAEFGLAENPLASAARFISATTQTSDKV